MIRRGPNSEWTASAPAKINLRLEVLGKRPDRYHELASLVVPLQLHDSVSFRPIEAASAQRDSFGKIMLRMESSEHLKHSEEVSISTEENLAYRAAVLLQKVAGISQGAEIHLLKRIPSQAGLGGGSSDAATVLLLANQAWGIHMKLRELMVLGAELGSDVPLFLAQSPAIFEGRGERIEPFQAASPLHVVLVKPSEGLSTSDVFKTLSAPSIPDSPAFRSNAMKLAVEGYRSGRLMTLLGSMKNDLENAAKQLCSSLRNIQQMFQSLGIVGCQMTGSGTTIFGICHHARHAKYVAGVLRGQTSGWVFATRTC